MATAKIHFRELIQDSQDYGSNDEHMVSRVLFDYEFGGSVQKDLHADIKQAVGSSFERAPLEIGPASVKGPFNSQAFAAAVETYCRSLVGSQGRGIHIGGGANVRMRDNRFVSPKIVEIDVDAPSGGSW